ncbi:hypothetical protein J3459_011830 [Metarhizium acridum]|nr:hypothetical protein J3459_011830 [Metarhizium acridum]
MPSGKSAGYVWCLDGAVETLNAVGCSIELEPIIGYLAAKIGEQLDHIRSRNPTRRHSHFVVLAGIFHGRCRRSNLHVKAVSTTLVVLYISMALILVRCIYRLVEHVGNTTVDISDLELLEALSPLLRYEVYFYIFEASVMLINSVIWNIWHPGRSLPRSSNVHLSPDGETEVTDREDVDDRSLLAKVACILTFGILFRKRTKSAPFHELDDYQAAR